MAHLSDVEIFHAALEAGFTPDQAVTMTAIALAESGGNTTALNPNGEHSVGLWQINTAVHDWDPDVAEDPVHNARMAYEVSGGGADITRWTVTHEEKGARYLRFRDRAEAAAAAAGHDDAQGQWNPPLGYHDDGVGAAPDGSTSTPLHAPGAIPVAPPDTPGASPDPGDADTVVEVSPFDSDRDGVFDAVEAWLGEDLVVEGGHGLSAAGAPVHQHAHGPAPDDDIDIDPDDLMNGRVADGLLAEATGGNDLLLAGAPVDSWNAMVAAAAADGIDLTYSDGYRPLHDQHRLADELGLFSQGGLAAAPGTSNHGLGLAIDINVTGRPEVKAWLNEHAHEYGWVADVPREPWHYEYREELDPDPDRGGTVGADDEPASAFDRDGDGVFDRVEAWLGMDNPVPPPLGHDHDHGAREHGSVETGEEEEEEAQSELPPSEPAADDELSEILAGLDLDPGAPVVVDGMAGEVRADLEHALAELAASRTGVQLDPDEFSHKFEHAVQDSGGILHIEQIGDLTELMGLDLDD